VAFSSGFYHKMMNLRSLSYGNVDTYVNSYILIVKLQFPVFFDIFIGYVFQLFKKVCCYFKCCSQNCNNFAA